MYSVSRKVSKLARNSIEHGGHIDYVLPTQCKGCLCVPGTTAVTSRSLSTSSSSLSLLFLLSSSTLLLSLNSNCHRRAEISNSSGRGDNILTGLTLSVREMSNQICLKWNSFLNNIATSFESLWEEEGLVDVTLASDGQCLTAHKVILSASSPFFKKVFQTNPCQHPVIILQDVHFSELEALLIFIYKGEVNIEQKNLPALLKAAETLQIRGLSGGDIFAKESYKRLVELEQAAEEGTATAKEETPKKKQKLNKHQNSILESALTPKPSQVENTDESTTSEQSCKEGDYLSQKNMQNPIYHRLEMKIEPLETVLEDSQKQSATDKDPTERLDTGQLVGSQGSSKPNVTVIADARETSTPSFEPETRARFPIHLDRTPPWNTYRHSDELHLPNHLYSESMTDQQESTSNVLAERDARVLHSVFPTCPGTAGSSEFPEETVNGVAAYPPFPCPFCDRAYTSWGFRRRHIKAVHTISPSLNCKWCLQVLPTHAAWRHHVILAHNLSASDAHNGLLILEEAHMVLQIARPTRLDTLVNIIKQNSQQNSNAENSQSDKD